ncbi:MAG: helix-turn-helix transcriptional regulator, partial [Raoultibacter sp.]
MKELQAILKTQGLYPIIGLSLPLAWIYAPFLSGELFYICFHLGFGCTLLAVAIVYFRHPEGTRTSNIAPWIAALCMSFAPLSVFALGEDSAFKAICSLLSGAGGAYCFCRWFYVFCALPTKRAAGCTLLSFSISSAMRLILVLLFNVWIAPVCLALIALPFISVILLKRSYMIPEVEAYLPPKQTREKPQSPRRTFSFISIGIELVVYGLIFGLLRNGISEWSSSTSSMILGHLLRIVLPLLLFFWLEARSRGTHNDGLLRGMLLAIVVILLAAVFFGGMAESVLSAIVLATRSFVAILIYLLLFEAVHRTKLHPCVVYGVGRATYELALVAGLAVYDQAMLSGFFESLPFNVIYFAVSCVVLLLLNSFSRTTKLRPAESIPFEPTSIDTRCDEIAQNYALTERELEIMKLISRGRSKKYIAGELFLSEDTIRWHTKQLYRKLE